MAAVGNSWLLLSQVSLGRLLRFRTTQKQTREVAPFLPAREQACFPMFRTAAPGPGGLSRAFSTYCGLDGLSCPISAIVGRFGAEFTLSRRSPPLCDEREESRRSDLVE